MASLFEAYITNLGKYNEGELVGETLEIPHYHGGGAGPSEAHRRGRGTV